MFVDSLRELRKTKTIVIAGLLSALNVVLGMFEIVIIPETLYLSFNYLSVSVLGYLCGPIVGALAGGICDILKFLANPQGFFFFGFTLNEILTGTIYGLFLYKNNITFKRCFACRLCIVVFINILLTPLWLNMMYGKAWLVYASTRIVKNLVLLPIESIIMYYVLKTVRRIKK